MIGNSSSWFYAQFSIVGGKAGGFGVRSVLVLASDVKTAESLVRSRFVSDGARVLVLMCQGATIGQRNSVKLDRIK